jgi:hypothetical protein
MMKTCVHGIRPMCKQCVAQAFRESQRRYYEKIKGRKAKKRAELTYIKQQIRARQLSLFYLRSKFSKAKYRKWTTNDTLADMAFKIDNMAEELQNLIYQKESIEKQQEMIRHGQAII